MGVDGTQNGQRCDLLGFGIAAVDELIEVDGFPEPDAKVPLNRHETQAGGICVNALAAASKLGLRCHYAGLLGDNPLSDVLRVAMRSFGITFPEVSAYRDAGPTHAFIIVDRTAGTRSILKDKSRTRPITADDLPRSLIASARAVYIDAHTLPAALHAARTARALGVEVVADFEEDDPDEVRAILPFVDHLILPDDYARLLTDLDDPAGMVRALAETGARTCTAVTCGERGCWYTAAAFPDVRHQPAFEVDVVDTTGCGDAFHGAYMAARLRGADVSGALRYASAAAALSARAVGAQAGLPGESDVLRLLAQPRAGAVAGFP